LRGRGDLVALKRDHPLAEVVASYGLTAPTRGMTTMVCCPFHDDHHPSLLIDGRDDHFHCFGCGAHGDVIDFVRRMEGIDFRRAVERLGGMATIYAGSRHTPGGPGNHPHPVTRERMLDETERACLTVATDLYATHLWTQPAPLAYLQHRGLALATVRETRVGYASGDGLRAALRAHGLPLAAARHVGLLDHEDRERLRSRVVVPALSGGAATWMIGRSLPPDGSGLRYLGLPGPKPLLGWDDARGATRVCVVEGVVDYLVLRQWGYPVLALLGTHVRPEQIQSLARFDHVDLILDNDAPGCTAATALCRVLGTRATLVRLPRACKDVADLALVADGRARFACLLDAARAAAA